MNFRSVPVIGCVAALLSCAHAQNPPVITSFVLEDEGVFLGGRGTFSYDVSDAVSLEIDEGVGVVGGAGARFSQTQNVYVVPRGSVWNYLADGSDQGASDVTLGNASYDLSNWKHPSFDDSGWSSGPAVLGYGDNPTTDVGFVDVDAATPGVQKNATTYYRSQFALSSEEIALLDNLFLELRRDDGAIVYLNGVEIVRMNVGSGVIDFDTYLENIGHSVVAGSAETTYFQCELRPGILNVGTNTLAVEVHQARAASSDSTFDLGLFQKVSPIGVPVFSATSNWRLIDDGSNLGDAAIVSGNANYDANNWKHPNFDDSTWPDLPGGFGFDVAVLAEATILRFGSEEDNADNDPSDKYPAYYFRKQFDLSAAEVATVVSASANMRVDDGAILYINGIEIARDGMDPGEVTSSTVAVGGAVNEIAYDPFDIPAGVLVSGVNTIAVEVHQLSVTSSDVSFDMELTVSDSAGVSAIMVPRGALWKYLDDGGVSLNDSSSEIVSGNAGFDSSNWKHSSFDDVAWRSGMGEFGYGDTGLTIGGHLPQNFTTELMFGDDPRNKFITTYFRKEFLVPGADLDNAIGARFSARIDDGAIVYLNGVEIWRTNLAANPDPSDPAGERIDGETLANGAAGSDGRTATIVSFDRNLLNAGSNTIAVELHQSSVTSSDATFAMEMELVSAATNPVIYTLTATNEFGVATATASVPTIPIPNSPIYLSASNGTNVSWQFPEVWSDKLAPHPGAYVAYGQFDSVVRTPFGEADPVFAGDSLDLRGATTQLLLNHFSGTAVLPAVFLDGGLIMNGGRRDLAVGGVGNSITVVSDSTIGTNGVGSLTVSADLSGSGGVRIRNGGIGSTIFTGDNGSFTGDWQVDAIFSPASATALGSGAINVSDTGTLDPGTDFLMLLPNPLSISAGGAVVLARTLAFESGLVSIDGSVIADGSYTAEQLTGLGHGGNFTGGASMFIGSVSPDSDMDGLLDSWELMFFTEITITDGSDDADGDGQSDGSEFVAQTSPIDALDVLRFTSVRQAVSGEVTLAWPSKAGVSYGVRYGDLSNWTVAVTGLAGTGAEISYLDDGTDTGGVPSADNERHYQVFVE